MPSRLIDALDAYRRDRNAIIAPHSWCRDRHGVRWLAIEPRSMDQSTVPGTAASVCIRPLDLQSATSSSRP
jgi:hypothetical protein